MHVYDSDQVEIRINGRHWNDIERVWGVSLDQRKTLADRFRGTPQGPGNRHERRRKATLARRQGR